MPLSSRSRFVVFALAASAAVPVDASSLYVLTTDNRIALIPESQPGQAATAAVAVTGLTAGDVLMGIDVRPQNNRLYGLGYNPNNNNLQLYHLAVDAGAYRATAIGSPVAFVDASGVNAVAVNASNGLGMDFNPAVDRIRVVTGSGQNFRINPNTGAGVDGDLGGAAGSVTGVNMDGPINGGATSLGDVAYTNNAANNAVTTLYTIDPATSSLYIQNPPNSGTQTLGQVIKLGGNTLAFSNECGLDIAAGVNAPASNSAASGDAYAALAVGGISGLYKINLATAAAASLGGFGLVARDIAVLPDSSPAIALNSAGTQLIRFATPTPSITTTISISGINASERLVGISGRPSTGQLYGLGVNPAADTATVYLVDPQTGAASVVGSTGQIAFVDALGMTVDLPNGAYGIDFNPQVDRIRVVSDTGLNFRANPITGAAVDGDLGGAAGSVIGANPDAAINGPSGLALAAVAYTNNVGGATVTTLYTLDPAGNRLLLQNPPNAGTQTNARTVTFGGVPFDFSSPVGFDIAPGVNVATGNTEAVGSGFAALGVGGTTSLYRIDLPTGAVNSIGTIGAGTTPVAGLVVWADLAVPLFSDGFE